MFKVKKRDGTVVDFTLPKIRDAVEKAFVAVDRSYTEDMLDTIALKVTAQFNDKIKNGVVTVEDIQDAVEIVLIQSGFVDVSKA